MIVNNRLPFNLKVLFYNKDIKNVMKIVLLVDKTVGDDNRLQINRGESSFIFTTVKLQQARSHHIRDLS